ncbi:hypothetical protein PIB30_094192 [Stylosanthes scabra]|uniref:PB1-like domain-containing protein n=1 Tax=Stylosanthes scabra TaxID=79078 RepID=A0ABU6YVL9_9FABA|nr:hypothetical protein [Stylosanthes scabra]
MGDFYAVLVFHHDGEFARHPNGELEYVNGTVNWLDDYELHEFPAQGNAQVPFRSPRRVNTGAGTSGKFRAKQPIKRPLTRSSPPPSEPPAPSQVVAQQFGGPSSETMVAAGVATQRLFKFIQTLGLPHKSNSLYNSYGFYFG